MGIHFGISPDESCLWFLVKKTLKLSLVVLLIGLMISFVTYFLVLNKNLSEHFTQDIPQSWTLIFKHNLKIYLLFCIPLIAIVHYIYAFFIVFVSIGLAFSHMGIFQSLVQLKHLPLELYALTIPIVMMHQKKPWRTKGKNLCLGTLILLFASWLEFYF